MNTAPLLTPTELAELHPLAAAFDAPGLREALLQATCAQGFSEEVVRAGLRAELLSWRPHALAQLMAELPADAPRPKRILVLSARTLPASTMRQVLFGLALGAEVFIKPASEQEAIADAIAQADTRIHVARFRSTDTEKAREAIEAADTVCVLGSDETVQAVAGLLSERQGYAPHGHKFSGVYLGALPDEAGFLALAKDVLAWDQSGCLAPRFVWLEDASLSSAFLDGLESALRTLESSLPLESHTRTIQQGQARPLKTLAKMVGGTIRETATTLLLTHPYDSTRVSEGLRTVWVLPFSSEALQAHAPYLTALATFAGTPSGLWNHTRLCGLGELQCPPLTWLQDGLHPLVSLLPPTRVRS